MHNFEVAHVHVQIHMCMDMQICTHIEPTRTSCHLSPVTLAGWLAGSLAGWLARWLAGWLVGWLAGWLAS